MDFYAPSLKGLQGASSNGIVHPSICLSVRNSLLLTNKVQLKLVNSNSLNSNFRITRVFLLVPIFFLHKVTKLSSDNSRSDNSRFRLTRADFLVPRHQFIQKYHSISRSKTKQSKVQLKVVCSDLCRHMIVCTNKVIIRTQVWVNGRIVWHKATVVTIIR